MGAGESGTGSAILAYRQGCEVFVSDYSPIKDEFVQKLRTHEIDFEEGKHSEEKILNADIVIKSPGIPEKADIIQKIRSKGIKIISEIEFAYPYTQAKHIAITGTNGKTTTTLLCYHLLERAGFKVGLGGNIGKSYAEQVAEGKFDYYVLELSSFQLDDTYTFRPDIAILTNITPDHLDRYNNDFEEYIASKFRIGMNQTSTDRFIYCADDEVIISRLPKFQLKAEMLPFSYYTPQTKGGYIQEGIFNITEITTTTNLTQFTMFINDFALKGIHNSYNSMAAAIAANALGIRKETIRESLMDFKNAEHRLEYVATVGGVDFINDSKATNVNSTWYALESMDKPVVWIVGGVDKGNDYASLLPLVKEKVKVIVCLGTDNNKIHQAFGKDVELMLNTTSAEEAVAVAKRFSSKGDVVLLSPACASFDLFANYEDRGWQFKTAVKNL